jgi:DNA-binding CsgD family transcriptional regulator
MRELLSEKTWNKRRPFKKEPFCWGLEETGLLGRGSDKKIAQRLGLSKAAVSMKRRMMGIPPSAKRFQGTSGFDWTADKVVLLGKISDMEVARRLGIGKGNVATKRRALGIPMAPRKKLHVVWTAEMLADLGRMSRKAFAGKYHLARRWVEQKCRELKVTRPRCEKYAVFTPAMNALMGKRSDSRLARNFHMSVIQIRRQRLKLGIPSHRSTIENLPWHEADRQLLGKIPDHVLAKKVGLSQASVSMKRRSLGIAPFRKPPTKWTKRMQSLLGRLTDKEMAIQFGVSVERVRRRRVRLNVPALKPCFWTPERAALLGTMPDRELARRLGVKNNRVFYDRVKRGIPPYENFLWKPEHIALLGTVSDTKLARSLGLAVHNVYRKRLHLKIKSFRSKLCNDMGLAIH